MKIVVIGGTGLIGSKTVAILREDGHEVVAARPKAASTPSPERGSKRPWPARKWQSTSPIRRHLKTRRCWNSSRLPGATFSRREDAAGVGHPLHHHPRDPVHGIPRRHSRFRYGWKHG